MVTSGSDYRSHFHLYTSDIPGIAKRDFYLIEFQIKDFYEIKNIGTY